MTPRFAAWHEPLGLRTETVVAADGTRLSVLVGGPPDGEAVVLVHGAPQTGYCWRRVIPLLSGRFRVVVPDLRGYGRSELAVSGRYDLETLTDDLGRVLDHASKEPVVLVTHDWGAPPGYRLLERTPGRVRHLVGVNAPHHGAFARELLDPRQTVRSWYIGLFQLPFAERLAGWREAQFLLDLMRWSSPESAISHDDLEVYRGSLARPGRAEAVLAYYRQAFERPIAPRWRAVVASPSVHVPATLLWGERDLCLAPSHPRAVTRYLPQVRVERIDASHWVPEERPEEVARVIGDIPPRGERGE
jgi:pimeloyl-ACP methyl ester carboxylesterase